MTQNYLTLKCYRKTWGDVGLRDIPLPASPIEKTKQEACDLLLQSFNAARHASDKPNTAQLIDEAGKAVAQFDIRLVVAVGPEPVEVPVRPTAR